MTWKKNVFHYLMWLAYAVMTIGILVGLSGRLCATFFFIGAGGVAFLAHRLAPTLSSFIERRRRFFLLLEAALVAAFLSAGLFLRLRGMAGAGQASDYYDAARVMEGQAVPRLPHVAAYVYVQMLHGAFVLLGNRFAIGIWIQIGMQLAAFLVLFFVMRKLAGSVSALVTLGFCVFAPFMIGEALVLSPMSLYFLLFMAVVLLMAGGCARGFRPGVFLPIGILAALCCYLDIAGFLLILLAFEAMIFHREETVRLREKISAACRCLAGVLLGASACVCLDASFRGTTVWRVMETWLQLYKPESFQCSAAMEAWNFGVESFVLFAALAFGIFSFWYDGRGEGVTACMLALCGIVVSGCYGMFTEEMPGLFYLYLTLVLLAGLGIGKCFHVATGEMDEGKHGWEALIEKNEENEYQRRAREKEQEQEKQVQYIENPLPVPKKHVKRTLDYALEPALERDDFDYPVSDEDDFDI